VTSKLTVKELIDRMVRRIVRKFRPNKVILFGSHARGEAGFDSDVDLPPISAGGNSVTGF
jgi:predicted nucleotidyltransferase